LSKIAPPSELACSASKTATTGFLIRIDARGHSYRQALRALSAKWLKIIFVMWERQVPYDEQYHLAMMTRQQLRLRQKQIA